MKGFVSSRLHPLLTLLLLVGLMVGALCVATFFIAILASSIYGIGLLEMGNVTRRPDSDPNGWSLLMLSQGLTLFIGFAGSALVLAWMQGYRWADYFAPRRPTRTEWLLLAGVLVIISLPAMSSLVEWNAGMHFPAFMQGFETWARQMEDQAQAMTKSLTQFNSVTRLLVALLVIAIVPAISEELVFRGVVQRNLVRWTGSHHVGIWLAAAIFSAIHFQFFGFIPRLALGVVFGYLYAWSGNILVPMAAHFTQNAFQLLLLYLVQQRALTTTFDPDSNESLPWPLVLLSALLSAGLLYYLYQKMAPSAEPTEAHTIGSTGVAVRSADAPVPHERHTLSGRGVDADRDQPAS
ncbi:Abortive infection protein [Hymenobacter roseosalivarius DSM 11622]|uniref:Abortive infection protein n=1 Tax=Hymenobacter roseosalivarius DSM 11622 TaxID=645990 RepID=A0A1W1UKY8_9BACT|nr:CPBP family intramembrane glutamic endopeptidase [Hymenobacter roseosalivarius]SMB81795.1 Abortive infection protein [Hymenobacter roseosalivarius DSM 11622]